MSSFIQIPIEQKVGKGNRILRPLKRDPMIEVSAYRDNQFKVWRHRYVIIAKGYVMSFSREHDENKIAFFTPRLPFTLGIWVFTQQKNRLQNYLENVAIWKELSWDWTKSNGLVFTYQGSLDPVMVARSGEVKALLW